MADNINDNVDVRADEAADTSSEGTHRDNLTKLAVDRGGKGNEGMAKQPKRKGKGRKGACRFLWSSTAIW